MTLPAFSFELDAAKPRWYARLSMSKTWNERRWEWLCVGKRIELVTLLIGAFAFLAFAIPAIIFTWGDATDIPDGALLLGILLTGCVGFSLTLCVPMYLILRSRRKKWRATLLEVEGGVMSERSAPPIPPSRVYALLAVVTLISATYQASHMEIFGRLFGRSTAGVFLWNFGILGAVLATTELVRRGKHSK